MKVRIVDLFTFYRRSIEPPMLLDRFDCPIGVLHVYRFGCLTVNAPFAFIYFVVYLV